MRLVHMMVPGRPASSTNIADRKTGWEFLKLQARVVSALIIREMYTRFGRDNIGFAWVIVEPAMFALCVIALWSVIGHGGSHQDVAIAPFLLCGYMPLLMYRHMTGRLMRCMQVNTALMYHRQVTVFTLYLSRLVVEVLGTSAAFIFCMVAFWFAGFVEEPDSLPIMLMGWGLYAWYAIGTSITIGALSERSEVLEKIWQPISYIMIPLSGTFFMVDWMPAGFREAILWSPPVNGVEMLRGGYYGPGVPTHYSATYMLYVNAILTLIGLYFLKDARKHVEVE